MATVRTQLRGRQLLGEAWLNKGTSFTRQERDELGLIGLLPGRVETIEEQLERVRLEFDRFHDDLQRHVFVRALQDSNEVLFYRFLRDNLHDVLPIVYTPTVGDACREFSRIYRRPHGLFLGYEARDRMAAAIDASPDAIDVIVVTDGERILGLGDQGLGGMGIPIGKLSLYTAAGGIDPRRTLPVLLDVGTNNEALRDDPLYLGARHERIDGDDYYAFVAQFVAEAKRRWPHVLLQWEDFAQRHATALLQAHRDEVLSFNDDIQGTAAVALATAKSGLAKAGVEFAEARVVIAGAGSAGSGVARALLAAGLPAAQLHLTDVHGLLHDRRTDLVDFQIPLAQPWERVAEWANGSGPTTLADTVSAVAPNVLIGVSGQGGLFTEAIVRRLADEVARPVILPLSNPTAQAEATPQHVLEWTGGRAVIATGSPSADVITGGQRHVISQANNLYAFPGVGLGALVAHATKVTDGMFQAASDALAAVALAMTGTARVLPPLDQADEVGREIALAVAVAARTDGVGDEVDDDVLRQRIAERWWSPDYPTIAAA